MCGWSRDIRPDRRRSLGSGKAYQALFRSEILSACGSCLPSMPLSPYDRPEYDTKEGHILIKELREARQSAGWSQRTLAQRIGDDTQTIKRLEKGTGSVSTLIAVMAVLDFRLTGLGRGKTLAEQLRNRRRKRAWSLDQAAGRAGLSRTTISGLEQGGGSVASLLRFLAVLAPTARRRLPSDPTGVKVRNRTVTAASPLLILWPTSMQPSARSTSTPALMNSVRSRRIDASS